MQRTRREILNILKRQGRATLEELANGVGLVPVTVRAHLNVLERDDLVKYEEVRGRVGRPYYVYTLTDDAEDLFPKSYDVLTNRLLDSLAATVGAEGLNRLAEHVAEAWAGEHEARLTGKALAERVAEAAKIRSEEGAWAEVEQTDDGYDIVQYNCSCPQVSARHPEVTCAAELAYLHRLLGADVERVSWRQDGSRICRYHVAALAKMPVKAVAAESTPTGNGHWPS